MNSKKSTGSLSQEKKIVLKGIENVYKLRVVRSFL
jgi:hypothetical protein